MKIKEDNNIEIQELGNLKFLEELKFEYNITTIMMKKTIFILNMMK